METQARRLFEVYWKSLNVPVQHQRLDPAKVARRAWVPVVKSIDSLFTTEPRGMFFTGPVGTGKTALLWLIHAEYAKRMATVYATSEDVRKDAESQTDNWFKGDERQSAVEDKIEQYYLFRVRRIIALTHSELIQRLRSSVSDSGALSKSSALFDAEYILLLDDLGRGYDDKSGWNLSLQDEYFDYRWKNNLPTFVTTNLTRDQLRSWAGWERIVDRLGDPNWMSAFTLGGDSKRKAAPTQIEEGR